ncbi:MAG: ATP-binding protein, partial [Bacteroidota bacterium]
ANEIADQYNLKINKAIIRQNVSAVYYRLGKLEEALQANLDVKDIYLDLGRYRSYFQALGNIGTLYTALDKIPEALEAYKTLVKEAKERDYKAQLSTGLIGLAQLYYKLDDYSESLRYNLEAIELLKALKQKRYLAVAYSNVADIYKNNQQIDSAAFFYNLSFELHQEIKQLDYQAYVLERWGTMYLKNDQIDKGLEYINRGIEIVNQVDSPEDELLLYSAKAKGLMLKGNSGQALAPLEKSIEIVDQMESSGYKTDVYGIAHEVYKANGNYRKAYDYLLQFQINDDSVKSEDQIRALSKAEFEYNLKAEKEKLDREQKETELVYEANLARQQVIAYAIGFVLLIVLVAAVLIFRSSKAKAKLNDELKDSNDLLSAANDKLQQLDQFKTRLFANINHDFRTPLTLINGYTSRIRENSDNYLSQHSQNDLDNLQKNADTLQEMTNEIQDLLLLEESKLKLNYSRVELIEYLQRQNQMFSSMAELSGIKLTFQSEIAGDLLIHLDLKHFEKILYNLISNAFRYTETGGSITVKLEANKENTVIKISDTGKGIDAKDLPHIFDRFYQSPLNEYRSKEGFGIGLAVVKELIDLHGGTISASSKPGVGTEFKILLPFNYDKPVQELKAEEEPAAIKTLPVKSATPTMLTTRENEKHTVLVVDDHEEIRSYIVALIADRYYTKEAANGKEALKLLKKNHADLILTDLMMPWLDGFDFIEQLQQDNVLNKIPVMVVSARTTEEDKHRVLDAGVNEFLSKPFDPEELQKRIFNLLKDSKKRVNSWDQVVNDQEIHSNVEQNIIKKLNQIILKHVADPALNTDMIALELNASRSKAIRLIKSLTGQTPLGYVKEIKMNYIDNMIKSKEIRNATEATNAIGMKNVTYFTKQYKSHFGKLPEFHAE